MLENRLPLIEDPESDSLPGNLPDVIDSHVHVFPEDIFHSIWKWFDNNAWPIRYRLKTPEIFEYLLKRGIKHIVALQYAHKPGLADKLNTYLAGESGKFPGKVTGLATVFPGEEGSEQILIRAFQQGLNGVKLHAHVQCFDMNSSDMDIIYETCASHDKPIVIHAGREPKSPAYRCDPYELCSYRKLESVLKNFPGLRLCVPHLGMDELTEYRELLEKYDNLWLDTTMALAEYFPGYDPPPLTGYREDRIMYGSDFPNIPYAWDRELRMIAKAGYQDKFTEKLLNKNAKNFFHIDNAEAH